MVYLDNIQIFSVSPDLRRGHGKSVLCRLRQHGLYTKPEKYEFEHPSILGFIISTEGVEMDPQKVSATLDF